MKIYSKDSNNFPDSVFVLSTGRTGTMFFTMLFNSFGEGAVSLHEPKPSYHLRIISTAYSHGKFPERVMLPIYLFSRRSVMQNLKPDQRYFESNNFLYGFMDVLTKLKPVPIFLHIIRDPREYIRSYLNHGAWHGIKWLAAKLIPYWQPDVHNILRRHDCKPTPINRFAAIWVHINTFLRDHGKGISTYHLIRFEDVFEPPHTGMEQLTKLVQLPASKTSNLHFDEKVNPGRLKLMSKWPKWSKEECLGVQKICGELMSQYGYGDEPDWQKKLN